MRIREIFCENPRIIFVLFYDEHKENMFTINLGDGREAPSKASTSNYANKKHNFTRKKLDIIVSETLYIWIYNIL